MAGALLAAGWLVLPSTGFAQAPKDTITDADIDRRIVDPPAEPSEDSQRRAAELYTQGVALARVAKAREAFRAFRASFELHGTLEALGNVAALELILGRPRAAAEHLTRALDRVLPTKTDVRKDLEGRLAEAKQQVGTVQISASLARAEIQWDATWLGTSPMKRPVYVDPDTDHVLLARFGGVEYRRKIRLGKGETLAITLTEADFPGAGATAPASTSTGGPAAPAAPPNRTPWIIAGSGAAVAFGAVAAVGFVGVAVADGERTKIERGLPLGGGTCSASPPPGYEDDCRARNQERQNAQINVGIGIAGAALAAGAVATTLGIAFKEPESKVTVTAGPGGVWIRGRF